MTPMLRIMHGFKLHRRKKLGKDVLSKGNNMSKIKEAWNSMGYEENAKQLGNFSVSKCMRRVQERSWSSRWGLGSERPCVPYQRSQLALTLQFRGRPLKIKGECHLSLHFSWEHCRGNVKNKSKGINVCEGFHTRICVLFESHLIKPA